MIRLPHRDPFRRMRWLTVAVLCSLTPAIAGAGDEPSDIVARAAWVFSQFANTPNGYPSSLLYRARCVMVLPSVTKYGFGIGTQNEKGVMSCRKGKNFDGKWSSPAIVQLSGISIGLQVSGETTDFVLLVMDGKVARSIMKGQARLGADASAAAGPIRGNAAAADPGVIQAQVLSYARSKGAFDGVSLGGTSVAPVGSDNEKLYGGKISAQNILAGDVPVPASAQRLLAQLETSSPTLYGGGSHGSASSGGGSGGGGSSKKPTASEGSGNKPDKGGGAGKPATPAFAPLPKFPWPPPTASARLIIPVETFQTRLKYGEISHELNSALDTRGYVEKSYYSVPNGFAVVTRMERIYPSGESFSGPDRWIIGDSKIHSISDYVRQLFGLDEGYFRVVVFIFTDEPFVTHMADMPTSSKTVTNWLNEGANDLPATVSMQQTPQSAECTVLIYEFVKRHGSPPDYDIPSLVAAEQHLTGSGIISALSVAHGGVK